MDTQTETSTIASAHGRLEDLGGRLRESRALLDAIDAGELLAEPPPHPSGRERHSAAVCLLSILSRELAGVIDAMEHLTDRA